MSGSGKKEVQPPSLTCVVKGYHHGNSSVNIGKLFMLVSRRGDTETKVANDRGQLGHLQSELVGPLWQLQTNIYV